jgi:hypothetical protein
MNLTGHTFEQTIHVKSADDAEAAGRKAVAAYFGDDLTGVEWSVSCDAQVNLAGAVLGYVGRVTASRG